MLISDIPSPGTPGEGKGGGLLPLAPVIRGEGKGEGPTTSVATTGGGWTIPILCLGIAIIAACLLVPLADENRHLVYERRRLELDVAQIQNQVAVNDLFLKRLGDDATLSERLAQRQMKMIRQRTRVVDLDGDASKPEMSPYMLVSVPPPPPLPAYHPVGGFLTMFCLAGIPRIFLVGIGLMLCAGGLVMGQTRNPNNAGSDNAPCDSH